jgi:uncharacterized membrane protein YjgN (DUF898 family)
MASTPASIAPAAFATPTPAARPAVTAYPVDFTGRGGEYFRVWIVNVLLGIVTLSLYTPWARRRTAQYFYSHTHIAGSPLEFVTDLRRMVFGFLVYFILYAAYELAAYTEQELATNLLAAAFAVLTPFVWGSAMRFRYRATRWRGIRLAFVASWKEVYLASWPVFAIAALWVGLYYAFDMLNPQWIQPSSEPSTCPRPSDTDKAPAQPLMQPAGPTTLFRLMFADMPLVLWTALGLAVVLTLLCVIRLDYNYTRLRVARVRMGGHMGRWKLDYTSFVKVWLAAVGMFALTLAGLGLGLAALAGSARYLARHLLGGAAPVGIFLLSALAILAVLVTAVLASLPARAWREARMFQLVWNNVGFGQIARTRTSLRAGAYVLLRVKNVLLSFLTLGFYRPFAIASEYAAKIGSVTIHLKGSPEQLVGELVQQQGAFGDAAADALGLDIVG